MSASLNHSGSSALPGCRTIRVSFSSSGTMRILTFENHDAQRRECHIQGKGPTVDGQRRRAHSAHVPLPAPAIKRRVAVHSFSPVAAFRRSYAVVVPRDRGEVTNE